MNFSVSSIFANIFFSVIGMWLFREGKKRSNLKLVVIAVLLMTYSYFTANAYWDWGIGAGLCAAAYYYKI